MKNVGMGGMMGMNGMGMNGMGMMQFNPAAGVPGQGLGYGAGMAIGKKGVHASAEEQPQAVIRKGIFKGYRNPSDALRRQTKPQALGMVPNAMGRVETAQEAMQESSMERGADDGEQ